MRVIHFVACALLTVSSAAFVSCGGGTQSQLIAPTTTDVYVAGFEMDNSGLETAVYWKNGTPVTLTNGTQAGSLSSIAVSGGNVYAAGVVAGSPNDIATYWINGVPTAMSDGTEIAVVNSMFISGTDIYVAGAVGGIGQNLAAVYWKNGVPVPLTDGTQTAEAYSIQVSGTDVYVAGYENQMIQVSSNSYSIYSAAVYWKNSVPVELTNGTTPAAALSLFISGSDVYVGGYQFSTPTSPSSAVYWVNATPVTLSPSYGTQVSSIVASGSTVYAAGAQTEGGMLLWQNGTATTLTGSGDAPANQVVVSGQDVYVAGVQSQPGGAAHAAYWKDGSLVSLPVGSNIAQSYANSIAVVTN